MTTQQMKEHFDNLGFDAEIDYNAPEAPWENTAVVLRRREQSGIKLVISIDIYTHRVVEIERRIEGGREALLIQLAQTENSAHLSMGTVPLNLPTRRSGAVTDTTGVSTLKELTSLVNELIVVRGESLEKENQVHTIDLFPETINVNREINRGSRYSQRSPQPAKKQVRQNL